MKYENIRPKGAKIKKTSTKTDKKLTIIEIMELINKIAKTIK